jgi:predicted MFS family arabinose efflux permease
MDRLFRPQRYLSFAAILCLLIASRMVFAPLLLPMERDLGLSHAVSTSFFLVLSVGYAVTLPLSGFVSARLEHRHIIVLATFTDALGLGLVAVSPGLGLTYVGLALIGASTGLYFPSGIASIYELVDQGGTSSGGPGIAVRGRLPRREVIPVHAMEDRKLHHSVRLCRGWLP